MTNTETTTLDQALRAALLEDCPVMEDGRFAALLLRVVKASEAWHSGAAPEHQRVEEETARAQLLDQQLGAPSVESDADRDEALEVLVTKERDEMLEERKPHEVIEDMIESTSPHFTEENKGEATSHAVESSGTTGDGPSAPLDLLTAGTSPHSPISIEAPTCPFCGGDVTLFDGQRLLFMSECEACGFDAPLTATEAEARAWWMRRPQVAEREEARNG